MSQQSLANLKKSFTYRLTHITELTNESSAAHILTQNYSPSEEQDLVLVRNEQFLVLNGAFLRVSY